MNSELLYQAVNHALTNVRARLYLLGEVDPFAGICNWVYRSFNDPTNPYLKGCDVWFATKWFKNWFTPDKFGITELYSKNCVMYANYKEIRDMWYVYHIKSIPPENLVFFYWFPKDGCYNQNRIEIIDKALTLLKEEYESGKI